MIPRSLSNFGSWSQIRITFIFTCYVSRITAHLHLFMASLLKMQILEQVEALATTPSTICCVSSGGSCNIPFSALCRIPSSRYLTGNCWPWVLLGESQSALYPAQTLGVSVQSFSSPRKVCNFLLRVIDLCFSKENIANTIPDVYWQNALEWLQQKSCSVHTMSIIIRVIS